MSSGIGISTAQTSRFLDYQQTRLRKTKMSSRIYPPAQAGHGQPINSTNTVIVVNGGIVTPTVTDSTEDFFRYESLPTELRMKIVEEYLKSCKQKHFVLLFDGGVVEPVGGPPLAFTSNRNRMEIYTYFAHQLPAMAQLDISSSRWNDRLCTIEHCITKRATPHYVESFKMLQESGNINVIGWERPSFSALVHLAHDFRQSDQFGDRDSPFTFAEMAPRFTFKFALAYAIELILECGDDDFMTTASNVFDLMKDEPLDLLSVREWKLTDFLVMSPPKCKTSEQKMAVLAGSAGGAIRLLRSKMALSFKSASSVGEAALGERHA